MTTLTEKVIVAYENTKSNAYVDTSGVPTIGSGFAMVIKVNGTWVVRSDLNTVLNAAGLPNATTNDINILQAYASAINNSNKYGSSDHLYSPLSFTFSPTTSQNVLNQAITIAQNTVKNTIGLTAWNAMDESQQAGITSYVYQHGSLPSSIGTALANNDYDLAGQIISNTTNSRDISSGNLLQYGSLNAPGKYAVAKNDTFDKIAQKFDLTRNELLDLNPDITNPAKLSIGQQINIPHHDGAVDTTSVNQLENFDPYLSANFEEFLQLDPKSFWDFGQNVSPTTHTDFFNISNSIGTGAIWSNGLTADFASGIVATGGGWGLSLPGSILNSDGLFHVAPSSFLSNGWRPGAFEPSDFDFSGDIGSGINWSDTNGAFYTPSLSINMEQFSTFGDINNYQSGSLFFLNIDPLVLDLTGAGIQLSNYSEANVLFNAANDNYKIVKLAA